MSTGHDPAHVPSTTNNYAATGLDVRYREMTGDADVSACALEPTVVRLRCVFLINLISASRGSPMPRSFSLFFGLLVICLAVHCGSDNSIATNDAGGGGSSGGSGGSSDSGTSSGSLDGTVS